MGSPEINELQNREQVIVQDTVINIDSIEAEQTKDTTKVVIIGVKNK